GIPNLAGGRGREAYTSHDSVTCSAYGLLGRIYPRNWAMDRWINTQLESSESTYPRIYTMRRGPKILYSLIGAGTVLGGLAIAAWFAANFDYVMKEEVWFVRPIISAVLILLGAAIIFFTLKYSLIFRTGEIEISSPLFGRTTRLDQIAGLRRLTVV